MGVQSSRGGGGVAAGVLRPPPGGPPACLSSCDTKPFPPRPPAGSPGRGPPQDQLPPAVRAAPALPSRVSCVFPAQHPLLFLSASPRLSTEPWGLSPPSVPQRDASLLTPVPGSSQLSTVRDCRRLPLAEEAGDEQKDLVCCGEAFSSHARVPTILLPGSRE